MKKIIYNYLILLLARPKFQFFYEWIFRILIGFLGYMNWSPDFKLTGEKKLWEIIDKYEVKNVLDIGANNGHWAEMVLESTAANIVSVEPQSMAYEKLISLNTKYINRFDSFNLALGSAKKRISMNIHKNSSELSFIDDRLKNMPLLSNHTDQIEEVEMDTLDNLYLNNYSLMKKIDFVKIDVEGYELWVLLGAKIFLQQVKPRFIQLEVNWHLIYTQTTLYQISQLLPGFNTYKILPSGGVLYKVDPRYPVNNLFQLSNFLFVRKDIEL